MFTKWVSINGQGKTRQKIQDPQRSVGLLQIREARKPMGPRRIRREPKEMKIEANPSGEHLKWLLVVILIAAGISHEHILGLI